jgi:hypothetical protein
VSLLDRSEFAVKLPGGGLLMITSDEAVNLLKAGLMDVYMRILPEGDDPGAPSDPDIDWAIVTPKDYEEIVKNSPSRWKLLFGRRGKRGGFTT